MHPFVGDRDKIGWEESAYKSSFVPFGPSLKPIKHSGAFKGPPTIQGDARLHESSLYGTTNNHFYRNKYQRKVDVDESIRVSGVSLPFSLFCSPDFRSKKIIP